MRFTKTIILLLFFAFFSKEVLAGGPTVPVASGVSVANKVTDAEDTVDLSTPEAAVRSLLSAFYLSDPSITERVLLEDASFHRVKVDGEVKTIDLNEWRDWIGKQNKGDIVEEIFDVKVSEFVNLASVWAPFIISRKGEIFYCGVNQFTVVKTNGEWRIINFVDADTNEETDCATFKETHGKE
ncbi:MAG: hypothetical protein AAF720_00260 [Pseudomonadota bacterium]